MQYGPGSQDPSVVEAIINAHHIGIQRQDVCGKSLGAEMRVRATDGGDSHINSCGWKRILAGSSPAKYCPATPISFAGSFS